MKAKSIKGQSPEEIKVALEQSMSDGFKPTLAIAFVSISQDRTLISKILHDAGIAIYGATSNGEFIDEHITSGEIAILLLDIKEEYFSVHFEEFSSKNYREMACQIAQKAKEKF